MSDKPVMPRGYDEEERYFHDREVELLRKKRKELDASRAAREQEQSRQAHWMKCPKCGADLRDIEMEHVKVDQCTNCQGVYFDRGEVEMLLEHHRYSKLFAALEKTLVRK